MILGLPTERLVVQFVLPAIVIAVMFVASYRRKNRAKGDTK